MRNNDGIGPEIVKSRPCSRLRITESLLVLFVFAGVLKAVPQLSNTVPWDLTMIFGALAAFAFSVRALILGKLRPLYFSTTDLWLIALCLFLAIGALYTAGSRTYAFTKLANLAVLGVLTAYVFPRFIASLSNPISVVRNCLLTILALAGLLSLFTFLGESGLGFLRSPGGSYLGWGYMLGAAIIAAGAFLATSKSRLQTAFLLMLIPLLVAALIYARGRGPLIALVGVLLTTCVVYRWIPVKRRLLIVLGGIALLAMLLIVMPDNLRFRYERLLSNDLGSSIESRLDAYETAWKMLVDSPIIGMGTGSFRAYQGRLDYPHNIILEAMAENGIVGLVLLIGFIGSVWLRLIRALRASSGQDRVLIAGAGLIFVFMLIGSMFSGDLTSRTLWFSMGLVVIATCRGTSYTPVGKGLE